MRYCRFIPDRATGAMMALALVVVGVGGALSKPVEASERARAPSAAGQLPSKFALARAVPADVCLYVHWVDNPEREVVRRAWKRFCKEAWAAKPHEPLKQLILPSVRPENRRAFEQGWRNAVSRFAEIDWASLTRNEVVLLGRMNGLTPELMLMFRDSAEKVEANAKALQGVLEALAETSEDVQVIPLDIYDAKTAILASAESKVCLQMARRGNVIALCYGPRPPDLMDDALSMLAGKSSHPGLTSSARFKQAMAPLPAPEDDLAFVDVQLAVKQVAAQESRPAAQPAERSQDGGRNRAIRGLVQLLNVYDAWASVGWTEGRRQYHQSVTALAADAKRKDLFPAVAVQRLFGRFDRYVPVEANAYRLWGGVAPSSLYDAVLAVVKEAADDPDQFTAEWLGLQEALGVSFRQDLLEWLEGRAIIVSLPDPQQPEGGSHVTLMLGVRDAARAEAKVAQLVEALCRVSSGWERPLTSPSAVVAAGDSRGGAGPAKFYSLASAGDAPTMRLVCGVADHWLILSSSPVAVSRCLATGRGEHPSIRANPRFKNEGLVPTGGVASASYVELNHLGSDLKRLISLLAGLRERLPDGPETKMIPALLSLLDRLGASVSKLDFFASKSSMTTFDGRRWTTKSVTTYNAPAP